MLRDLSVSALLLAMLLTASLQAQTPTGDTLPNSAPLTIEEPLDVVMVRGISQFAEHLLNTASERRGRYWNRDYSSLEAYEASVAPNRVRLREYLGAVDPLVPPRLRIDAEFCDGWRVAVPVEWDVLKGVHGAGYLLRPFRVDDGAAFPAQVRALVVAIPDATQTPEAICGLDDSLPPDRQWARRLAENGCLVLVVAPISRDTTLSGHPDIRYTNFSHREFVYRCAFELGRHVIGYELQMISQARSALVAYAVQGAAGTAADRPAAELPVAVAGVGEGGMLALYAAAIDTEFDGAFVSSYFQNRNAIWQEPIDRNVWRRVSEFGDADIASLIAPRRLLIETATPPLVAGPAAAGEGRAAIAAPGSIGPYPLEASQREALEVEMHYDHLNQIARQMSVALQPEEAPAADTSLQAFLSLLGVDFWQPPTEFQLPAVDVVAVHAARQQRLVGDLIRHTQMLLHRSDKVRDKFWSAADRSSAAAWETSSQRYRDHVHEELIGRLPLPNAALNPRTRRVIDEPTHVGYEVMLDVYVGQTPGSDSPEPAVSDQQPQSSPTLASALPALAQPVIAGGILLLPKDLQPGERRPVVVCQHGLEGTPMDTITTDPAASGYPAYKGFSTALVQRGFIVYAPQNPYRGYHDFRVIQRKSNPLGLSLFSYIIEQHRQTLRWLGTLPCVDPERIAFYGLSYGGKTAVRVPPLLLPGAKQSDTGDQPSAGPGDPGSSTVASEPSTSFDHPGYCLSICSADFNEWIRKNCSAEDRYSYVYTMEYEIWEWNMGHIADYAELSSLMAPRPFMVERGHDDGVAPDEWVGWEFAKVRRHYDKLGLGERTEIEWFNGPHTINGQGTFAFLHRHLDWPVR